MKTPFLIFVLLATALLGLNTKILASDTALAPVFIALNEQIEISQELTKVSDYLSFLNENGSSEEGHETFYHEEVMKDLIKSTLEEDGYHYSILTGKEEKPIVGILLEETQRFCQWKNEQESQKKDEVFYDLPTEAELKMAFEADPTLFITRFFEWSSTVDHTKEPGSFYIFGVLPRDDSSPSFQKGSYPGNSGSSYLGFRIVRVHHHDSKITSRTDKISPQQESKTLSTPQSFSQPAMMGMTSPAAVGRGASLGASALWEDAEIIGEGALLGASLLVPGLGEAAVAAEMAPEIVVIEPVIEGFFTRIGGWMSRTATRWLGRSTASAATQSSTTLEFSTAQRIATIAPEEGLPVAQLRDTGIQSGEHLSRTRMVIEAKAEDPELQRTMEELDRRYAVIEAETQRKADSGELYREAIENGGRILREMTPDHPYYEFFKDLL